MAYQCPYGMVIAVNAAGGQYRVLRQPVPGSPGRALAPPVAHGPSAGGRHRAGVQAGEDRRAGRAGEGVGRAMSGIGAGRDRRQ